MVLHPNGLPYGTTRRSPAPSFAHAILLDQFGLDKTWAIIDLYGCIETLSDEEVKDWEIVYTPLDDKEWAARKQPDTQ